MQNIQVVINFHDIKKQTVINLKEIYPWTTIARQVSKYD